LRNSIACSGVNFIFPAFLLTSALVIPNSQAKQGYGTLQIPQDDVYYLCGFSDEVFKLIPKLEDDKLALINEIESMDY
jgi:hypothetical protein